MRFTAWGHPNITAKHRNTLEFTKEPELTKTGTCIIGVKADFELQKIKEFLQSVKSSRIKIFIRTPGKEEVITAQVNRGFNHGEEMVIRKSDCISSRTFGIRADKGAADLDKRLVEMLKKPHTRMGVVIQDDQKTA